MRRVPPTTAHLNGSVNLPDAETVMREVLDRIPRGLRRVPDGETGDRSNWIFFQFLKFKQMEGLELRQPAAESAAYARPKLRLRDGADAVDWPDLGYARAYLESYEVFRRLDEEGLVPPGVRFQAQYPTPLASIVGFIAPEDQAALEPSYERALFADLQTLLRAVPHERIAVQWDVAVEFGMLELPEVWGEQDFDALAGRLARCLDQVPEDVPCGAHLCYGDAGHEHFKQPESLALQVRMMNAVSERARRPVSWFSTTVPQAARDPAYFTPLADLRVDDATELYFALVPYHPAEQPTGTTEEQARLIDERLGAREWGICTECGMGRVDREDVPPMLDAHREILARLSSGTA
jgi:hypothetical protein